MKPSIQQEEIYKVYDETNCNLFISATAGSGKTTTIVQLAKRTPPHKKVLFTSFSNEIVRELKSRLPESVDVSTIHSKGYSILRNNVKLNVELKEIKNWIYGKKIIKGRFKNKKDESSYLFVLSEIINLMKLNLVSPDNREAIIELCEQYGILTLDNEISDTIRLFNYIDSIDYSGKEKQYIDFTDMLYLTNKLVKPELFPKYDVIFQDEVQDMNPIQRELILKMVKPNGRIISVGDFKQTIYSFQGSNLDSLNYFKNMPNTKVLPLSVTYRCGFNIVKEAKNYFDDIEAFENNSQGIVRNGKLLEAEAGDFVLCRNNLPLIEAFIYFLKNGKKSSIRGKDFQKNLLNLIRKVNVVEDIQRLREEKANELINKGIENYLYNKSYIDLDEKLQIIEILLKTFETIEKTANIIEKLFTEDKDDIHLMTIHKSKGLESKRIFLLNKELLPSKYAITDLAKYSERALGFVAVTRAKEELIYCNI